MPPRSNDTVHTSRSLGRTLFAISASLLLSATASVSAATRTWPGAGPCAAMTLSDCIATAADGDVIEIATDIVDEVVVANVIDKSLRIRAAAGYAPTFAYGRRLLLTVKGDAGWSLRVSDLKFDGAGMGVDASGNGRVELDHLDVLRLSPSDGGISLYVSGTTAMPSQIEGSVHDNHLVHDRSNGVSIKVSSVGAQISGRISVHDNLIESAASNAPTGSIGILCYPWSIGGGVNFEFQRNRVHPRDWSAGQLTRLSYSLYVYTPSGTSGHSFLVAGNSLTASQNGNTTLGGLTLWDDGDNRYRVIGNTLVGGQPSAAWINMGGLSTGVFANNAVIGGTSVGLNFLANTDSQFSNHHNAVFGAPANHFTPGTGTVVIDPLIATSGPPRPRTGSPLVHAGSTSEFFIAGPGSIKSPADVDADGLRRVLGSEIDIGAYEFGSTSFTHDQPIAATSGLLDHPLLNGNPGALIQITRSEGVRNDAMVINPRPMSQRYDEIEQRWRLLADDAGTLPANAGFSLFTALPSTAVGTMVVSSGSVVSLSGTALPAAWSGLSADSIFLVSATRGAGLSATADPHPVGAARIGGQWRIVNLDGAAMPVGAAFAIYAQTPSRNAYEHIVSAANQPVASVSLLTHPLLDDFPCAIAHISASGAGTGGNPQVSLHFESGLQRWFIQAETAGTQLIPGQRFFVVVDPRSVEDGCIGPLFDNSFE